MIGKTNVPEFGYGSQTYNDVFGPTRNPYDLDANRRRLERRGGGGARGGPGAGRRRQRLHGLPAQPGRVLQRLRLPAVARAGRLAAGRVGVRGPDRHRRPDGPQPAGPRRAAGHARRPASRAAVLDRRGPGAASRRRWSRADPARLRIGWLGDLGGHLPFEPGILELCEAALARARRRGGRRVAPGFDPAAAWEAAVTLRHYDATWALELPRERLKPELRWEAEGALAVTGPALHAAQRTRTGVAAALRALLRDHDALALPSAQVFPFDVETHWPREIAGRPMPTYHRWMEVVSSASLAGLPAAGVPAGFGARGLPMGMQLIGRPRGDRALLELTEAYDRATGWVGAPTPPLGSPPCPSSSCTPCRPRIPA